MEIFQCWRCTLISRPLQLDGLETKLLWIFLGPKVLACGSTAACMEKDKRNLTLFSEICGHECWHFMSSGRTLEHSACIKGDRERGPVGRQQTLGRTQHCRQRMVLCMTQDDVTQPILVTSALSENFTRKPKEIIQCQRAIMMYLLHSCVLVKKVHSML